jgi:hypothetical protein
MKPSTALLKFVYLLIVAVLATIGTRAQATNLTIDAYNGQYYSANWSLTEVGPNAYNFSYTFSDDGQAGGCGISCNGYEIKGSLTGTPSGPVIDVSSVSNVELLNASLNVVIPSLGTNVYHYTGDGYSAQSSSSYFPPGGAYVSLDGLAMNFLIANGSAFTEYFYVIPWTNGNGGPGSETIGAQFVDIASTPLPSTWTMMLIGLAGLGIVAYRRQRQNATLAVA